MNQEYLGKRGVIYTRVSSQMQLEKGNGLQSQEAVCRERAKDKGIEVVAIFSDGGVSGKFSSRAGLDEMIEFLKSQNKLITTVDLVICDDIDRLSRDILGWHSIKNKIEVDGKAEIQTVKYEMRNTSEGELFQNITMAMKQYERQNNADRVKARQRGRLLNGYWVFTAPNGYEYQGKGRDKKLERTDDTPIIKEALELYAQGGFKSDREMYYYINDKLPHISIKGAEKVLGHDRLLFYAGFINYPKFGINMVKAQHDPLISLATLENIESRKNRKVFYNKASKEDIKEKMPLRHYIYCPFCGKPYTGGPSKSKSGNLYYYYRCGNTLCSNNKSYNIDDVHKDFGEYLKTLEIKESTILCFKTVLKEIFDNEKTLIIRDTKSQKEEIKKIDEKIKKLVDLITDSDDPLIQDSYRNKLSELTLKKTTLQERVSSSESYEDFSYEGLLNFTLPLLKSPYKLRTSKDPKIKQLVPSVVFGSQFLYSENIKFTTPRDSSIYADFHDNFFQKSLSLEAQRQKYNTLIMKLKSKQRILRYIIGRDKIDISRYI